MAQDYQQTSAQVAGINSVLLVPGGVAGTRSASFTAASAGAGLQTFALMATAVADPGTPSFAAGALIMRWNITTANSNLTWSYLEWNDSCQGTGEDTVTVTSGLAISLGTTGVKTASCTTTANYNVGHGVCGTDSAREVIRLYGTSVATMVGIFVFVPNQLVTFPFTSGSGAAAPASVFNLASTRAGK